MKGMDITQVDAIIGQADLEKGAKDLDKLNAKRFRVFKREQIVYFRLCGETFANIGVRFDMTRQGAHQIYQRAPKGPAVIRIINERLTDSMEDIPFTGRREFKFY